MTERNTRSTDDPATEILATSGLLSMLGAVVATVTGVVAPVSELVAHRRGNGRGALSGGLSR